MERVVKEATWKENTTWTGRPTGKRERKGKRKWKVESGKWESGKWKVESGKNASHDNQRLWRRAIVLLLLRDVVKDACYERRRDKMTDRNKFSFSHGGL